MTRLILPLILAVSLSACASVGSFDVQLEAVVHDTIKASEAAHDAKLLPDTNFRDVNVQLAHLALVGGEFTRVLKAGTAGTSDWQRLLAAIAQAFAELAHYQDSWAGPLLKQWQKLEGMIPS